MFTEASPFTISLVSAILSMVMLVPVGTIIAWKMGFSKPFRGRMLVDTLLLLPLALPPTVIGYSLLLLLGRGTAIGVWLNDRAGIHLIFTWIAGSIAGAIMASPLYIRIATTAFREIDRELIESAAVFGAGNWDLLRRIVLPLAANGLLAGFALAFARALGEFGATILVAGNIPGSTQTLPLALYSAVQNGEDRTALNCTVLLVIITFVIAIITSTLELRGRSPI